jgi:hypothetical protein
MFSTAWVETPTTLLFNEATVYNAADQVAANDVFMGMLEDLPESGPETVATWTWYVILQYGITVSALLLRDNKVHCPVCLN